jgi:hypothetical protein
MCPVVSYDVKCAFNRSATKPRAQATATTDDLAVGRFRLYGDRKNMKKTMSRPPEPARTHEQWARFRFSVVGLC